MKTYHLSVIAKKLHVWHYTAEKYLTANGVKPIHVKNIPNFGTYKVYAAVDADPVMKKFRMERAQKEAAKLQKQAAKAVKKMAKGKTTIPGYTRKDGITVAPHIRKLRTEDKPTRNDVIVKVKQPAGNSNDEAILSGLRHLYVAINALTKAVQENTKTISENGLAALEVATRPDSHGKH